MAEKVTVVPIGVGGVRVGAWAEGGELHDLLIRTVEQLKKDQIEPDYILWHQGETDNILNTPKEDYIRMFETIRDVFRSRGIQAPIVIAQASYHRRASTKTMATVPKSGRLKRHWPISIPIFT